MESKKMSKGFDVEVEMPQEDLYNLIKKYKRIKKYQKSNLHQITKLSGKSDIVTKLIEESEDF